MKIKICGVKDPDIAAFAAHQGADYVGLIFHTRSKRNVTIKDAKAISKSVKKGGAEPVAVFVNQRADHMESICKECEISIVQLHGKASRADYEKLPPEIKKWYVVHVMSNGEFLESNIRENYDLLLYDGMNPGIGKSFAWDPFKPNRSKPFFLSGGLNAQNVQKAMNIVQPDGVDVSSGVEDTHGNKSKEHIIKFMEAVKNGKIE